MMELPWSAYRRIPRSDASRELQRLRPCPLCGADADEELLRLTDFQFYNDSDGGNRADHRVVSCKECGLVYTNPCYTDAGFQRLFEKAGCSYGHIEGRPQEQAQWLAQHCPATASVTDIGCGMGAFLKALPPAWRRTGMEVDGRLVARADADAGGVKFIQGNLGGRLELPAADVFTMFHVLEHVPDPRHVLAELRRNSDEDSCLIIEVPVIERAIAEQGCDIVGFFSVQHLSHFSEASLKSMLSVTGWHVVLEQAMPGYNGYRILARPSTPEPLMIAEPQKRSDRQKVADYLAHWRDNVVNINRELEVLSDNARVMIWGAGQHSEYLALLTGLFGEGRRFVIVDSDALKRGTRYHDIPVLAPEDVAVADWRSTDFPIVISSYGSQEAIKNSLLGKSVSAHRIVSLYDRIKRY